MKLNLAVTMTILFLFSAQTQSQAPPKPEPGITYILEDEWTLDRFPNELLVEHNWRSKAYIPEATEVTSVAQTNFMSAGPTDTLEQRHNVLVGAADVTSVW
ncbi:hypothetical protein PCANC_11761 [Puccinia coronata f. sp. avenae]|uniref:Uncharacterized protein n=1 Tax=Puccinia coronata f. sp. avenae TaxID=200324 RepID=A0A2N5UY77_9BASI|nr:hypothetical protein PCANC_11761 [Puccinia coronata f. sp. avenae]